ncbi:MAG: glycosyltransferase family 4 protein, partial [Acidimicrobiia bacterium]
LLLASHVPASGGQGGMVRYCVELARALEARDDVELHALVSPDARPFFAEELGIDASRLHTHPFRGAVPASLAEFDGRPVRAFQRPFDVIHGGKHLLPRRHHAGKLVLAVHDMLMLDRPLDHGALKRTLLPPAYLDSIRRADVLLPISHATRERLRAYAPDAAHRATVVPLAMAGSLVDAEPVQPAELNGDRPFALIVGDLSGRKNVSFVVELWSQVQALVPDAHLVVVGPPGWGHNVGAERLAELVALGAATCPGHVRDGQLRWMYQHAHAVLAPSLFEGFGLPVLEASAFGAPVIASDDPAMVEIGAEGAEHVPITQPRRWVYAIAAALSAARPPCCGAPRAVRTWAEVAAETVAAARTSAEVAGPELLPVGA